jgi:transcriptional regulator with XRE-family HTH domain
MLNRKARYPNRIKEMRERLHPKVSLAAVAAHCRVTASTVHKWENGSVIVSIDHLYDLAEVLHCRVSDLIVDGIGISDPINIDIGILGRAVYIVERAFREAPEDLKWAILPQALGQAYDSVAKDIRDGKPVTRATLDALISSVRRTFLTGSR